MKPIRPYKIWVYNLVTEARIGEFYSNQVPQRGDRLNFYSDYRDPESPFDLWGQWRVDGVRWAVASAASATAFEVARQSDGYMAAAYCEHAEVFVWPDTGPFHADTPKWAKALMPPDDDGEDDEPAALHPTKDGDHD